MRAWLRELRIKAGMTLHDLSMLVGVSEQALSYYENGDRRPSPEIAMKIGKALGFHWTRFFEKEGEQHDAG